VWRASDACHTQTTFVRGVLCWKHTHSTAQQYAPTSRAPSSPASSPGRCCASGRTTMGGVSSTISCVCVCERGMGV
jgi:hypothetical protein